MVRIMSSTVLANPANGPVTPRRRGRPSLHAELKTVQTAFRISKELDNQLRERAKQEQTSVGYIVRCALMKGLPLL